MHSVQNICSVIGTTGMTNVTVAFIYSISPSLHSGMKSKRGKKKMVQIPWHTKTLNQSHWPHFCSCTSISAAILHWLAEDTALLFLFPSPIFSIVLSTLDTVEWCPPSSRDLNPMCSTGKAMFSDTKTVCLEEFRLLLSSRCCVTVLVLSAAVHQRKQGDEKQQGWKNNTFWLTVFRDAALGYVLWCCFL